MLEPSTYHGTVLRTAYGPIPLADASVHDMREALRWATTELDRRDARLQRAMDEVAHWRLATSSKHGSLSLIRRLQGHLRYLRFIRDMA